jgi:hypothetical protein
MSQPSLEELARDGGHVERGVEDHAVGEQRVELDDLLLLGGVVALDRVVSEPQRGREAVVGLDLLVAVVISSRSSGSEIKRGSVIVRISAPGLPGTPCSSYLVVLAQEVTI